MVGHQIHGVYPLGTILFRVVFLVIGAKGIKATSPKSMFKFVGGGSMALKGGGLLKKGSIRPLIRGTFSYIPFHIYNFI
jgi:hypothetical protein